MSVTLDIINNFTLDNLGVTTTGKQGLAASDFSDVYGITAAGKVKQLSGVLATAAIQVIYDDSVDTPVDFLYLHIWGDVTHYVQLITAATNVVLKLGAYIPLTFGGFNSLLAAAATTAIAGGAEPATADIKKVVLGNYSGGNMNWVASFIL